jgi:inhibitor of KinA
MKEQVRYLIAGDRGLLVEFGDRIDPAINARVRALDSSLRRRPVRGVIETIPTYRSLAIVYDPLEVGFHDLLDLVRARAEQGGEAAELPSRIVTIPACYGGEQGPDIAFVAEYGRVTIPQVIEIHSSAEYLVYMIGFTPGFPYLGGLDERLAAPRLETPRKLVPAGSVGIAGNQTGIYPMESPGGWRLIARTPVRLFDPGRESPVLLRSGDRVRFEPIGREAFLAIEEAEAQGRFRVEVEEAEES